MLKKEKWVKLSGNDWIEDLQTILNYQKRKIEDDSIDCIMYSNGNGKRRSRKGSLWSLGWK